MVGENVKKHKSDNNHRTHRETCKAVVVFTPLLVLIICCCFLVLSGYKKFNNFKTYSNFIFNEAVKIENVCEENKYRNADAKKMVGKVEAPVKGKENDTSSDTQTEEDTITHEIVYPYYGDIYAHLTIDNDNLNMKDLPIYWGDSDDLLNNGVCQSNYSTYIGVPGRVVLAAHNHTYFYNLKNVQIDDVVTLTTDYGKFTYKVTEKAILDDTDTSLLYYDPTAEDVTDDLIMYTCWNNGYMGLSDQRLYFVCEVVSKEYYN